MVSAELLLGEEDVLDEPQHGVPLAHEDGGGEEVLVCDVEADLRLLLQGLEGVREVCVQEWVLFSLRNWRMSLMTSAAGTSIDISYNRGWVLLDVVKFAINIQIKCDNGDKWRIPIS